MRWVDPEFNISHYDSIVYNQITYFPPPKPTTQAGSSLLDELLRYTNDRIRSAMKARKPLVLTPGVQSLIFRGAITGINSDEKPLQYYEVIPVALVVAGTQMVTGHRTMNTYLFFEGEIIDASTKKAVIKFVRKEEGRTLPNETTPMALETFRQVIDDLAVDVLEFNETSQDPKRNQ